MSTRASDQQIETAACVAEPTAAERELTMANRQNPEQVGAEWLSQTLASRTATSAQQTPKALTPDQISEAARALAKLPRRRKRKWSGWLSEKWRGYRDQQVILPSGDVWFLYGALRGKAIITPERGKLPGGWGDGPFRWLVIPANEARRYENPAAQLLGRQKAGVVERKSEAKARAARLNGSRPTNQGRKRGRPPTRIRSATNPS